MTDVGHLYDWLSRYVQFANWIAYRDRFAGFTMHKPLGEGGVQAVNDRLLAIADLPSNPRVLDAGCGFGGTIFAWHARIGGTYDGLTLSRVQTRVARREAEKRGIDARFHLSSFDDVIDGKYDAVIAIETLIHASDLSRTIRNLASALAPGGKLLVVDDVAAGEVPRHDADLLATHWGLSAPAESRRLSPCVRGTDDRTGRRSHGGREDTRFGNARETRTKVRAPLSSRAIRSRACRFVRVPRRHRHRAAVRSRPTAVRSLECGSASYRFQIAA